MDSYHCLKYLRVITHPRNIDVVYSLIISRFDSVTVVAGVVDLNGSGVLTQSSEVIPYYDFNPPKNVVHNIGLIRLSTPLTFYSNVSSK
jgi:hypothetical protein